MKSKELKVFYEDIDTGIDVKAMVFVPEERVRASKKQEDRKLAEEYIDR